MYENEDICRIIGLVREHDDAAFDELVRRYTPLMRKLIVSIGSTSYEYNELFSEVCVALHSAARKYDLSQSEVTFGLFARICIRNRLVDLQRIAEPDHTVSDLDIEQLTDEDSIDDRLAEREIFDSLLGSCRSLLSDYEYRVLLLHIQGYKTAAIASMLSRTAKSVDNAKARLFKRLRAQIGDISNN